MKRFLGQIRSIFSHSLLLCTLLLTAPAVLALTNPPSPLSFYPYPTAEAAEYLRQAETNPEVERPDFLIKATLSHIQRNELEQAKSIIDTLFSQPMTVQQSTQTKLLKARIALYDRQAQETLNILYTLPPYLPYSLMMMQQDLQALAYESLEQPITSIEQRLALQPRLKSDAEKKANLQAIWKTVQHIPPKQVLALNTASHNPALKAWLSLATMQAQYQQDPIALERAIHQWQVDFPNHPGLAIADLYVIAKAKPFENDKTALKAEGKLPAPVENRSELVPIVTTATNNKATPSLSTPTTQSTPMPITTTTPTPQPLPKQIVQTTPPALPTTSSHPGANIAVLLPKTGEFAQAAKAIEQGIILAYYQEPENKRPVLQFYDTANNAREAYQRAIQRGAKVVIGPLAKEQVIELYNSKNFPVTTIALNELAIPASSSVHSGFYQFSLSNDDEAFQVAQRANQDSRMQALVIRSDKSWAKKSDDTFSQHFERFGGSIRERLTLNPKGDPTQAIQQLLQFYDGKDRDSVKAFQNNQSAANIQAREQLHVTRNGAQSRHRTDVDMIFLALSPTQAQQVIPLLKFYYAQDIPVYTTSVINSQSVDERQDLDGALFCDMPWIINNTFKAEELRQTLNQFWPHSYTMQPRLYAFGMDAYRVARDLQNQNPALHQGLQGYTGKLSLVSGHRIYRQLPWAQIRHGQFRLLDDARVR